MPLPRLDVVCFGEMLWDLFEVGPRGAEPIGRAFRRELGGASANVATGLARLGVHAAVVGAVGDDRFGDALIEHLATDGVDVRFVARLPAPTAMTFVARGRRGRPAFLPYRTGTADAGFRSENVTPAMARARWVLIGTSALAQPHLAAAAGRLLDLAERGGALVGIDLNARPHLWKDRRAMDRAAGALAGRATLVKASTDDLRALAPAAGPLRWLERHAPRASWLVTRAGGSATAIGAHGVVALPAWRARAVDATGAGDAFLAGSVAALLAARAAPGVASWREPEIWRAALRVGHILGRKAVSRAGAVAGLVRLGRARAILDSLRKEHRP
jgi:fructokinase